MGIELAALDRLLPKAVRHFWKARRTAAANQKQRGISDQGNRAGVTAGKNLDGFIALVRDLIIDNGIPKTDIYTVGRAPLTLPGFYRPTKNWDLLVITDKQLIAAIEFKSQVGPSFGNNFNNRVEEALGNAADLNTALREGVFGESSKPFLGFFFVLEECPNSMRNVRFESPHFPAMPEFNDTSYAARYEILCRKLVQERLYDAAALLLTPTCKNTWRNLGELTSPHRFAATLAGKIATAAAN